MDKLVPIEGSRSLDNYSFDYLYLRDAIDYLRKHAPQFKNASLAALAAHAGLAESTFKKLLAGSIEDPRSSTLWMLCIAFDLCPRALMKLPSASTAKPGGNDQSLVEDLRRQLRACDDQRHIDEAEMSRLRNLVLEKGEAKALAEARSTALEQQILVYERDAKRHRSELRWHRMSTVAVSVLVLIAICGSFFV